MKVAFYLRHVAVHCAVADLIYHAVIHIFKRRVHPGHIQLTLHSSVGHRHICWRI